MQKSSRNGSLAGRPRIRTQIAKRAKRQREYSLEALESRTLLSYTFSYNPATQVATAAGSSGATDSLIIEPVSGFLYHEVNGGGFVGTWGGLSVPAAPTVQVNITVSTGDGSSLTLGTPTGPASELNAFFNVVAGPAGTDDSVLIDDSEGTTLASSVHPYSFDTQPGSITGPGINFFQGSSLNAFGGGLTFLGSSVDGDIYNVYSTYELFEPLTIVTGDSGDATVNIGDGVFSLGSPLAIYSSGGLIGINIYDYDDDVTTAVTFDDLSGNSSAPYEITGIHNAFANNVGAPIEYGSGVASIDYYGGTAGTDYSVEDTQFGTGLYLYNNGDDLVYVSDFGSLEGIQGAVYVENDGFFDFTDLVVDASFDDLDHLLTLSGSADGVSTLTDFDDQFAPISYLTYTMNSVTIDTSDYGYQVLAVDFAGGNPIPIPFLTDVPGLSFNGGADSTSFPYSHQMILYGVNDNDPFVDETNNAQDPDILFQEYGDSFSPFFGDIQFTDSFSSNYYLEYTGLQPITDIVPVDNYTFNDFGYPDQSFSAYDEGGYTTPDDSQTVANGIAFFQHTAHFRLPRLRGDLYRRQDVGHLQRARAHPGHYEPGLERIGRPPDCLGRARISSVQRVQHWHECCQLCGRSGHHGGQRLHRRSGL